MASAGLPDLPEPKPMDQRVPSRRPRSPPQTGLAPRIGKLETLSLRMPVVPQGGAGSFFAFEIPRPRNTAPLEIPSPGIPVPGKDCALETLGSLSRRSATVPGQAPRGCPPSRFTTVRGDPRVATSPPGEGSRMDLRSCWRRRGVGCVPGRCPGSRTPRHGIPEEVGV